MISGSNKPAIRKAVIEDLDELKQLVDQHKLELGFVVREAIKKSVLSSEVIVATSKDGSIIGFAQYRHRKDGQTTLYNIVVATPYRRRRIAHQLIDALLTEARQKGQNFVILKCPMGLPANEFYKAYGFNIFKVEDGKHRALNIWRLEISLVNEPIVAS